MSEPAPTPDRPSRLPPWAPFVVLTLALIAQVGVIQGGWLLDDARLIRDNADIARGPGAIPRLVGEATLEGELERGAYRPLMLASFALEAPLWSSGEAGMLEPFGFHLVNLLLHGLAAVLLCLVVGRAVPGRPVLALASGLLFAVHPLLTPTVGVLLGRADLLAFVFGAAAVLVSLRPSGVGGLEAVWIALFSLLAFLAKEAALVLPVVLLVAHLAGGRSWRDARFGAAGVLVALVAFAVLWPGRAAGPTDLPAQGALESALLGVVALVRCGVRLLVPVGYRGDHSDEATTDAGFALEGSALLALGLAVAASLAAVWWLRRSRGAGLGRLAATCWLGSVACALVAGAVQPADAVMELRFAYLATPLLFVLGGRALEALVGAVGEVRGASLVRLAGAAVVVLVLGGLALREAEAWHDDETFHERLLAERPAHIRALVRRGRIARLDAELLRAQASAMPTEDKAGRPNLALADTRRRRAAALEDAEGWIRRALSQDAGRKNAAVWAELAFLFLERGHAATAAEAIHRAKGLDPVLQRPEGRALDSFDPRQIQAAAALYYVEGRTLTALDDKEAASSAYQAAIQLSPRDPVYLRAAAMGLMGRGRWAEGLPLLERAVRHATSSRQRDALTQELEHQRKRAGETAVLRYQRAEQELAQSNQKIALEFYEAAFQADPRYVDAYVKAARIRGSYMGDYKRAARYLLEAERVVREDGGDAAALKMIQQWRAFLAKRKKEDDAEIAAEMAGDAAPEKKEGG